VNGTAGLGRGKVQVERRGGTSKEIILLSQSSF
jgi:hypothetical protein